MANAWTRGAGASVSAAEREPGAPLEVTAGLGKDAGQKVVNQLAALERLKPDDAIVAFIDADALPTPIWLARLVAVLINSGKPLATGYRWMTPADDRWSSSCLTAANDSIASLPRGAPLRPGRVAGARVHRSLRIFKIQTKNIKDTS